MSDWKHVEVPRICERLIGFSVPDEHGELLVISYEGMHLLKLGEEIKVTHDNRYCEYDLYDPNRGVATYNDRLWPIIGLMGGDACCQSPQGEELRVVESENRFEVYKDGIELFTDSFENFSGDWVAGTFSTDGNWLIIGFPYDFDMIIMKR
ncbi:hypothetical protein SAMN02745181_0944 [Rubritalea squalenifaciens DSM 18772]|uniref:Uncharacterized protein n=1 Tax=Rubritalea squalenifaciens DSM 18772 TaxID=1123071 RepID=A0A1M6E618_9BACT|nr:hypothetical protein [Rubritalea squalenifaciens]SHI80956.1 hypothetical protein SAMN02745181_0944 [Rubritalea squalenifaciens DSM 18772]